MGDLKGDLPHLRTFARVLEPLGCGSRTDFWRAIEPVELREAVTGYLPDQATRVRSAWDAREWRILFEADDTRPWATLTERDGAIWTEEAVEVFIDPVGDLESYFELEVNPLGTVTDLVLRRTCSGWRKEFAWNAYGLETHVRVTGTGWEAELSIPFAALMPDSPRVGRQWRANFLRIDRPHGSNSEADLSAWSPTGARNFHRPERFGMVEFVR